MQNGSVYINLIGFSILYTSPFDGEIWLAVKQFFNHIILVILVTLFSGVVARANERMVESQLVVEVPFVLSGGDLDDIHRGMITEEMRDVVRNIKQIGRDSTIVIKRINFFSSVSPEGTIRYNRELGKARLVTAEQVVRSFLHLGDDVKITYDERFIPWEEYLLPAVMADKNLPYRDELLAIISRKPDADGVDNRRLELRRARNGELWDIVNERYFSAMRRGGAVIVFERPIYAGLAEKVDSGTPVVVNTLKEEDILVTSIKTVGSEPIVAKTPEVEPEPQRSTFALSVKSNSLGWALAMANGAVEIDFARHWSLSVPVYYSAINYFISTIKFRVFATQPEFRYWLREDNSGFFAGAHFGVASYNIAVNGNKRYQDHNGTSPALGGGISVGYRMPLTENQKWNIEFVVGVGGYKAHYDTFHNVENGRLIGSHSKTYWGVDNVGVNVSYRFDFKKHKR